MYEGRGVSNRKKNDKKINSAQECAWSDMTDIIIDN